MPSKTPADKTLKRVSVKTLLFFLLLPLLVGTATYQKKPEKVWVEKNGLAVIEAEHVAHLPPASGWKLEKTLTGYMGSGYLVWRGRADWGPESRPYDSIPEPEVRLSYQVQISTPGTYYLKVRNQHQHEDGDNDVWTSVNGSAWGKTYDWQQHEWSLDERGTWAKYVLPPGLHKVELAGRSRGFAVDRLILFLENTPEEKLLSPLPESKIRK
jgi:hypothetical protein